MGKQTLIINYKNSRTNNYTNEHNAKQIPPRS